MGKSKTISKGNKSEMNALNTLSKKSKAKLYWILELLTFAVAYEHICIMTTDVEFEYVQLLHRSLQEPIAHFLASEHFLSMVLLLDYSLKFMRH